MMTMKKDEYFASPASTYAPSPNYTVMSSPSWSEQGSESDYQYLPELALPASQEPRLMSKETSPKKTAHKVVLLAWLLLVFLVAPVAVFFVAHTSTPASKPVRIWNPDLRQEFSTEPLAKSIIRKFDAYNMARGGRDDAKTFQANVDLYMMADLLYESVGFGTWRTPAGWNKGEESNYGNAFPETIFTQMLFFGNEQIATTTTYGSAFWGGDWEGVKAPNKWVTLRITDFYYIHKEKPGHGKIAYNFMMIDWVDALRQIGRRMLPPAQLEEGLVLPPAANDGVPAPLSKLVQSQGRNPKVAHAVAEAALNQDWVGTDDLQPMWHKNLTYYGPGGIGLARNLSDYQEHVLKPFRAAFSNRKALVELHACEGNYCGLFGRLSGHGVGNWLGLPTAGHDVSFRFAMHYRVMGNKVQEGWSIFDFPGLFADIGLDFYKLAAAGGRL